LILEQDIISRDYNFLLRKQKLPQCENGRIPIMFDEIEVLEVSHSWTSIFAYVVYALKSLEK